MKLKKVPLSGMEWKQQQLRDCRRPLVVVVLLLLFSLCCVSAKSFQRESNNDGNTLWPVADSLQPGSATHSAEPSEGDLSSTLWELPIITGADCDVSTTKDGERSISTGSSCHDDDASAASNAAEVHRKEETVEEKHVLVACNVKCFMVDPVCGEDAVTYWCGAAEARCAGVEVAYKGYCDSRSGGAGKDGTRAGQSLFLVHLLWLVLAGFLVIADLL